MFCVKQEISYFFTIMGPWLAVGACWNKSSDSSSVVSRLAGGGGGLAGACVLQPSDGNGGLGGAAGSKKVIWYVVVYVSVIKLPLVYQIGKQPNLRMVSFYDSLVSHKIRFRNTYTRKIKYKQQILRTLSNSVSNIRKQIRSN